MARETVRTTWDEVERRKKLSPGARILFSTESEETDWRKSLYSLKANPSTKAKNPLSMVGKMKNNVVWLSTSSSVSWLQVWKQMHLWLSLPISTCWRLQKHSASSKKKKVLKEPVAVLRRKNVQGCVSQDSDPMNSFPRNVAEMGLIASAGHTRKFSGCTWYRTEFGKEKGQSGGIIQKGEVLRRNTWGNLTTRGIWRENMQAQSRRQLPVKAPETQKIVCLFQDSGASMHNAEQGDLSSDTMDTLRRSKTPSATYRDRELCKINE